MSRTYILNLLFLINYMCKVGQFCNVGSHAQQMCHTPSLMDIYTGKVGENFITTQLTSSSLILKSTSYLEDEFQPHVGRTKRTDRTAELQYDFLLLGFRRKFDQRWLWSTLGPIKLKTCGRFDFWRPYYLAQKSRSKGWPFCCCVDF